jgi:sugar phosphate isomerase/epimerase
MALHLHDNDGSDDQHRLSFDGIIDWSVTMSKKAQAGYTGAVAIEAANIGYENLPPEEFLHLLFKRAKRLESLL